MKLSIIIPALNEASGIQSSLKSLRNDALESPGTDVEIILVDGGSDDETCALATPFVDRILPGPRGRARQMNAGAAVATGEVVWFFHADTLASCGAIGAIEASVQRHGECWGRFDVSLMGKARLLRIVERLMNLRSCLTGVATGDQGIFVTRELFEAMGGFAEIPLMEDIELSTRLRSRSRPICLRQRLRTSARRWEKKGVVRTIMLMWFLRAAYFFGLSPSRLAKWYR